MATNSQHQDFTKYEEFYDSDAEQQSVKQQHSSQGTTPEIREMKSTIKRLQTQLQQEVNTSRRLRHVRDKYRATALELSDQVTQLQSQVAQLQHTPEEEAMYDSDDEDKEPVERKVTSLLRRTKKDLHSQQSQYLTTNLNGASQQFDIKNGLQARYAPASQQFDTKLGLESMETQPASHGSNKYYPDVPEFHGDPTKWEAWQLHLDSKFRASAMLFSTEQSHIDYIRDHYKSITFNVIKARCLQDVPDPYTIIKEIFENLDNIYSEFDSYGKVDARLHSFDFDI